MQHIKPLNHYHGKEKSLFIAGGISDCPDWQYELANALDDEELVILNPRREDYPENDPEAAKKQISWEYEHLRKAHAISFWFPKETLCPITLYELGRWNNSDKQLFVGVHPGYARKEDVEVQTGLARPNITIVYDLESLAGQIKQWNR